MLPFAGKYRVCLGQYQKLRNWSDNNKSNIIQFREVTSFSCDTFSRQWKVSTHSSSFHFKLGQALKHISDSYLHSLQLPKRSRFSFIHFSIYFQLVWKPSLSEMKILLFTKSVALFCLLLTEVRSSENFKIVRETSPRDTFTIPPSKCDRNNDTFNYCSEYNAAAVKGQRCQCGCHDKYATFSFYKQSWSCLKNEDARTFFGKLSYHSYCCFSLSHLKTVTVRITNKQACFNFSCSFSLIRTQWITFRGKRWRFKVHFNLCLS